MRTIHAEAGESPVEKANKLAKTAAAMTGRTITVDDSNPARVLIKDYNGIMAEVVAD
jgi:ABC-type Fe3+-hydroxamate transport system substrate-binding protein